MNAFRQVKTRIVLALLLAWSSLAHGADPAPDARQILRSVRLAQTSQHMALRGHLRTGPQITPFQLLIDGGTVRYEFTNPQQALVLRLGEKGSRLEEIGKGGADKVTPAEFGTKVRNTDISYEDLSMQFLYWPNAAVEGEETKLLNRCWKVRVEPGGTPSQYSRVVLWVAKESGALLQADAFDKGGNLARRFAVRSVQKDKTGDGYILKQMRIEAAPAPGTKDRTPTYLEIEDGSAQ